MARASRDAKIETRSARLKLKVQHEPYWTAIGQGLYFGYRKGNSSGSWWARVYVGDKKYRKIQLTKSDDYQDSNKTTILNYYEAQDLARKTANKIQREAEQGIIETDITVADAINSYLKWYKFNKKAYKTTEQTAKAHIIPSLGKYKIDKLTTQQIRLWIENIAKQPPKNRAKTRPPRHAIEQTPEELRKRKASANRILTVLKAALNHAWHEGKANSDDAWRKIKPFKNVDIPKIRYLSLAECTRLVNASDIDFRQLIQAALLTGCRYGELINLKVSDFNKGSKNIHLIETKSGKPRHVPLTDEGFELLKQITVGKTGNEHVFTRQDGEPWGKSHQTRRMKDACERAKINPRISFHILRHTYGSLLASKGVPLQVIAELLGHSDTRVTSRHYAHLMPSFVADTLRANLPNFSIEKINHKIIGID